MRKIFLILLTSFVLFSCSNQNQNLENDIYEDEILYYGKNIILEDIWSINNWQTEWTWTWSFWFYSDYPIFSGTNVSSSIISWLDLEFRDLEKESKEAKEYMPDLYPEFQASFEIFTWSNTTSIAYETYKFVWWAHGIDKFKSYTFDDEWKQVNFKDLFIDYDKNLSLIKNVLVTTWKQASNPFNDESIIDWIDLYLKNPSFYIDWPNLMIMFDKYLVSPWSQWPQILKFTSPELIKKEIKWTSNFEDASEKLEENVDDDISLDFDIINKVAAADWVKYIALTFDDGPSKKNTPKLLDVLSKNWAKATFYVLWKNTSYFPQIVKRAYEEWHEIGSHSWDHPQLTRLWESALVKQRDRTDNEIKKITWKNPATFRPPYGSINAKVKKIFNRPAILWSLDTLDWKYRNVSRNVSVVTSGAKNWAIILFHDIHTSSVNSIEKIIKNLKAKWYEFITVSDLLARWNKWKAVVWAVTCSSQWSCK